MSILDTMKKVVRAVEKDSLKVPDIVISRDTTKPLTERKAAYKRVQDQMLNPVPAEEFDPETFEPMEGHPDIEVARRERVKPPRRLPTMGLKPKKILEGQMVGMTESKQDLYLLIAHAYDRISDLEDALKAAGIALPSDKIKK